MNHSTTNHPDQVLEAILAVSVHPAKKRNLALIHQICRERYKLGLKDFSLKSIGEASEAQGGIKTKALWNAQSADYRKLIEAWQAYVGPKEPNLRETARTADNNRLIQNIPDPATRIIVEQLLRERNSLRAELNILKSEAVVTIDRRPRPSAGIHSQNSDGSTTVEVTVGVGLNQLELEALQHAISKDLWDQEGWAEGSHGRVVLPVVGTDRVRTIFKPGFVSAVRKALQFGR